MQTCLEYVLAPFHILWLFLWPILSILLGIVAGCLLSVVITAAVFLLTLVRTPLHIAQMLRVVATTTECFQRRWYSLPMRAAVFLAVPPAHLLFLVGVTAFSGTIGTLYYVGKATKMFYKHEYTKNAKKIQSNARMEPKSKLGEYYKACQDFVQDDEESYPVIYLLKGLFALVPGMILAALAMVPFSLGVLVISLVRLPINVYKTTKIALFTVVLQWDLRLVVLATLPLIHTVFPLATFLGAVLGSFFWTWGATVSNIVNDDKLSDICTKLSIKLKDYYEAHQAFVGERCHRYDHPSGIPYGWDGRSYGIDFERLLRWQRDFLVICFVIILGTPFCFVAACLLSAFKYIPGVIHWWRTYTEEYCWGDEIENKCVAILSLWPFHVLAILLTPAGALICHVALILFSAVSFPFQVREHYVKFYAWRCGTCRAAQEALLQNIQEHDRYTAWLAGDEEEWAILNFKRGEPGRNEDTLPTRQTNGESMGDRASAQSYWDRFVSQCIRTTASLLEKGLIQMDDVQGMEPSVIQSIPAVAILTILVDSVNDNDLQRGDLKWTIDGMVCKERDRPVQDGITHKLWPMVSSIERLLRNEQEKILIRENIELLATMLVANNENETDETKEILAGADPKKRSLNNTIRTMINGLVLAILRVRPYQERMNPIFTHDYSPADLEHKKNGKSGKGAFLSGGDIEQVNDDNTTGQQANTHMTGEGSNEEESPYYFSSGSSPIPFDSPKEIAYRETNMGGDEAKNEYDIEDLDDDDKDAIP